MTRFDTLTRDPFTRRPVLVFGLLFGLALALTTAIGAQSPPGDPPTPSEETAPKGFVDEILLVDRQYGDKLVQLAEAIPAEHYGWRPAEGVRSIGEALLHTADMNFKIAAGVGVSIPEDLPEPLESVSKKERVLELLEASFEDVREGYGRIGDEDLLRGARMNGVRTTVRGAMVAFIEHQAEHLGQLIAYARSVGVTPPWSFTAP